MGIQEDFSKRKAQADEAVINPYHQYANQNNYVKVQRDDGQIIVFRVEPMYLDKMWRPPTGYSLRDDLLKRQRKLYEMGDRIALNDGEGWYRHYVKNGEMIPTMLPQNQVDILDALTLVI